MYLFGIRSIEGKLAFPKCSESEGREELGSDLGWKL